MDDTCLNNNMYEMSLDLVCEIVVAPEAWCILPPHLYLIQNKPDNFSLQYIGTGGLIYSMLSWWLDQ